MHELEELLECYIKLSRSKIEKVDTSGTPGASTDQLCEDLKEIKKNRIVNEIIDEHKKKIQKELKEQAEKEKNQDKISSLRNLMYEGIFIALFIGLAVNQITNLISIITPEKHEILVTIILVIVFCSITVLLYIFKFIKIALEVINSVSKKK